jgi:hypothetical protein
MKSLTVEDVLQAVAASRAPRPEAGDDVGA